MSTATIALAAAGILLFIFILVLIGIANAMVNAFLIPGSRAWNKVGWQETEKEPDDPQEKILFQRKQTIRNTAKDWMEHSEHEDVWTAASDGVKLHALLFRKKSPSNRWVVVVHGYRGGVYETCTYGMKYFNRGYNVLLLENRTKGQSGGKCVGMGWLEKNDLRKWIDYIIEKNENASIVLHGESMGGATIMMALGDNPPSQVAAAVSDCGYTGVWQQFSYVIKNHMHKSLLPVLHVANLLCKIRCGYSLKKASSVNQLRKNTVPLLLLHGGNDDFVPTKMIMENYVAAAGPKDWFIIPNAGHCQSQYANPDAYWSKVWEFLDRHTASK